MDFIWDNKPHKIKTNTLIGDKNEGGLKLSEFESMNKALKASWVRRFNTEVNAPWKIIPNYMTRHLGGFKFLLSCSYKTKELSLKNIPCFYSEILNCWETVKKIKAEIDQEKIDLYEVIIWNNHEIKIATKPIFYESWHKAGVTKVKHLLNPNSGKLLTYQEFVNLFKIKPSFTVYYGLLHAIKNKWNISPSGRQSQTLKQNWYDDEENLSNAALHKIIVGNKYQPPTNENRIISYGVEPSEIKKIYKWPFSVTNNTKLIMFQFKINHNIIYTRDKLKRANIIPDDLCYLCKSEQHTIQHMFLKCSHVALFWNEFFDWWSQVTSENIKLPDSTILYGPTTSLKHHQPLSLALLVAKYFIYKCNLNEQSLLFSLFKTELRENIMTERYIAIKNKTAKLFNEKWKCLTLKDFVPEILPPPTSH